MSDTVQDLIQRELMDSKSEENEMLQLLEFTRDNGVPLTPQQAAAIFILRENEIDDLANYVLHVRTKMTPIRKFFDLISKLTLADRIKGNAKLSGILKANANPANGHGINMSMAPPGK